MIFRSRRDHVLLLVMALSTMTPAHGATPTYEITLDPARSQVTFSLGAFFHTVQGRGIPLATTLEYAPGQGLLTGAVILPAAGLATGNQRRDRRMQGQVLESAAHPDIILTLERAEGAFDPETGGDLQVEGSLQLLGASHPVSFPLEIIILLDEEGRFRARGAFMVPYVAWGLKDPSMVFLRVEKEVRVSFSAAGRILAVPPPGGKGDSK
ncbi:MAG: YceI family protein [Acidobacteria bacterium]|nr:YceI family protein [Acidobacteriota bacterium]